MDKLVGDGSPDFLRASAAKKKAHHGYLLHPALTVIDLCTVQLFAYISVEMFGSSLICL